MIRLLFLVFLMFLSVPLTFGIVPITFFLFAMNSIDINKPVDEVIAKWCRGKMTLLEIYRYYSDDKGDK